MFPTSSPQPPPQVRTNTAKHNSVMAIVNRVMSSEEDYLNFKNVEELDEDGIPTGNTVNVRISLTSNYAIAMLYLETAKKDKDMLKDLINRIDGKPVSTAVMIQNNIGGINPPPDEKEMKDNIIEFF